MPSPRNLLCLALLALPWLAASPSAAPQATPDEILKLIRSEGDATEYQNFARLARIGTDKAFKASKKAVGHVRQPYMLEYAYRAFVHYRGAGKLEGKAFDFVANDAQFHRREENQRAATEGLRHWGERSHDVLESILISSDDELVRQAAVRPLLKRLGERNDKAALLLVIENSSTASSGDRRALQDCLDQFSGAPLFEVMFKTVSDGSTAPQLRLLLVDRLMKDSSPEVIEYLVELMRDEDPAIQMRAVEALGKHGAEAATKPLWKVLRTGDGPVLRAAIIALGQIMGGDAKWKDRLFDLAEDKDPAARMGAAVALVELRTPEAVQKLYDMLEDADYRVRIEVVQQVGNLRRKDSIPILIERLAAEKSRLQQDVASVLRLITGLDQGRMRPRWKAWWDGEGETFEVPPYEEALANEQARRERRKTNNTVASFYGLNVVSDRVCFILDTSGSMNAKAKGDTGRTSTEDNPGTTRLEVAKFELSRTLDAYPDGDYFNIIFFESSVKRWEDELMKMSKKTRKKAKGYVAEQVPSGGTAVFDAIEKAMEDERVDTIYVLTDGSPTAGRITDIPAIRAEVARMNAVRKVQINGIAVGTASPLLRQLAEDSGGQYREVL